MNKCILFIISFLIVFELGTCLKCFVCTSKNSNETCKDPFKKDNRIPDICDLPDSVCLKEKSHSVGFLDSVHRGCVVKTYCEESGKSSSYCSTCVDDLCNSSIPSVPSLCIFILLLILSISINFLK